jgi:putative ABC transport system permease protein
VAIFTVVYRVVLNPLPYPGSGRLVELDHGAPGGDISSGIVMSLGLYHQYLDRARTLDGVALHQMTELTLTGSAEPEQVWVIRATPSLASVLQVVPAHGRWFTGDGGTPGAAPVAVLSHGLWMRRYGAHPWILGQPVMLNGVPTEVIGIMPSTFAFPDAEVDIWIPLDVVRSMVFDDFGYVGTARLVDGVSVADARLELNNLIASLPQLFPHDPSVARLVGAARLTSLVRTLKEATIGDVARGLWMLASVAVVLLVAYANVTNLFLVRAEARQREIAVCRALGAGNAALARYWLLESGLLSIAGGIAGIALAWIAVRLLVGFGPTNLPRLEEVRLDGVTVAFTSLLTMAMALSVGAISLWKRAPHAHALRESGRGNTAARGRHRMRQVLIGGQVALALILLVASGLMVVSYQNLRGRDPGFDASNALTVPNYRTERPTCVPTGGHKARPYAWTRVSS